MSLALLMTSDVLDVHHDGANAWLYLDWKGPQDVARVHLATQQVAALVAQTGVHKALNDNTRITETSWELVERVATEFVPLGRRAGLEYVAWVYSPLLSCRSNIDLLGRLLDHKPQVAFFSEIAAACSWLSSVRVPAGH